MMCDSNVQIIFSILNVSTEVVSQKSYEFCSSILSTFILKRFDINIMTGLENFIYSSDEDMNNGVKEILRLTNKISNFYYYSLSNTIPINLIEKVIYRFDLIDAETLCIFFKTAIN